ncbi:hypothetical protein E1A91_D08G119800v1 [Gossypium mustelinum]|uniref:Uncharacterized protein n=1 Tax=Gossypium mustelinum TaxID=34275 RepID=A0A5D2TUI7_GOSMU|nr:hypothetical protein E1A91_D08G119800v1 [Gossypium mustelinum]
MNPSLLCFQFSHRRCKFQRARCLPPAPIRADRYLSLLFIADYGKRKRYRLGGSARVRWCSTRGGKAWLLAALGIVVADLFRASGLGFRHLG